MFRNDYRGIFLLVFLITIRETSACGNVTWLNPSTFGFAQSVNFFFGEIHPVNLSCQWQIIDDQPSDWLISIRVVNAVYDQQTWTNEIIFRSNGTDFRVYNDNRRTFFFPSTSLVQIDFPIKPPLPFSQTLSIQRFFLEFSRVPAAHGDDFHCQKSDLIIPRQWRCNCLYECGFDDVSDEEDCPLCDMIQSSNTLLCHSNESWCLPMMNHSSGACVSSTLTPSCSYQIQCENVVSYAQDYGEILVKNSLLSSRTSLCFAIMTKDKYQIQLIVQQYDFLSQHPGWEYLIYDGDQIHNQLLASSKNFLTKQIVQTRGNRLATIVLRKRFLESTNTFLDPDEIVLNITWSSNFCPADHFLCSTRFEQKCYGKQQRCDGIWDCIGGDDELGCLPSSCPTLFACRNQLRYPSDQPRCYTWFERCNGNPICPNRADEQNCSSWWCNANNGTFLCRNGLCIYESWRCDGTNDCGDYSDEIHCSSRPSRRVITVIILGVTFSLTFFLIALGCMCKLVHLRAAEQRASIRLANSEEYFEQRQANERQRVAPPSYSQTMGFSNETDDRLAVLAEQLRLAGLTNFIPARIRERTRRNRFFDDSYETAPETQFTLFDRLQELFTRHLSINNNRPSIDEIDISERRNLSDQFESREFPPAYPTPGTLLNHPEQANSDDDDDDNEDDGDDDDDKMLVP